MTFQRIAPIVHEVVGTHYGYLGAAYGELGTLFHQHGLKREQLEGLCDNIEEVLNALLLVQNEFQRLTEQDEADVTEVRRAVTNVLATLQQHLDVAERDGFGEKIPAEKKELLSRWSKALKIYIAAAVHSK